LKDAIQFSISPQRKQISGIAATHVHDIVIHYKGLQIVRRQSKERKMPGLAGKRPEGIIKTADVGIAISTGGRDEADTGTGLPALLENIALQRQIIGFF
jgi:hypothetical protein